MISVGAARVFLFLRGAESFLFKMIFAATMIYMVGVGLDPLQLVLVGTCLELAVFVFEVPTGVVADRVSRRLSVIIGFVVTGIAFILMGLVPRFVVIALASGLWGIGYTFTSGAVQAWIVDEVGQSAAEPLFPRSQKLAALAGVAGTLSGMGLGALQIQLPIVAGGGLVCILASILRLIMPEEGFVPPPRQHTAKRRDPLLAMVQTVRAGMSVIGAAPLLIALIFAEFLFGAHSEGYDRLRDAHLLRTVGVPEIFSPIIWLGGLGLVSGLLVSAGNAVSERLIPRMRRPGVPLAALTTMAAAAIGLFAATRSFPWAAVALVVVGSTRGIADPILTIWVNRHIPSPIRATVLSIWGQADAAGQVLLGPLIGLLGRAIRVELALAVSGFVLLPIIVLYLATALGSSSIRRSGDTNAAYDR